MRKSVVAAGLLAAFLSSGVANAQVLFGSIVGNVTDPSKAPVPGAAVTIRQPSTGEMRSASTSNSGAYTFNAVAAGRWEVTVTKSGFRTFSATDVAVAVDQVARVDAGLQIGDVSQNVQVSAQSGELQTDSSQLQAEIGGRELRDLPVPINRNYESLLVTVPGFTPPANQNSTQANPSRGLTFAVNGAGRNTNNIRIDGASSNNVWLAEVAGYVPGLEAIEAVSVVTNSFDQTQGLAGGAAINVHIKSGTNELHGSGFEYNINNAITARPFFGNPAQRKPKNINNDTGGTVGGPIVKNRLFYFVSYDGNFIRQNAGNYVTTATAAMRSGDLSGSANPIYDPATGNPDGSGRTAFTGNIIPASRISPIAAKLIGLTPLPNIPNLLSANYYATGDYSVDRNTTDAKIDWHVNDKLTITPRLGWTRYNIFNPNVFGDNGPGIGSGRAGTGFGNVYSTTITGTYIAQPNLIIDSHFTATVIGTNNTVPKLDQNIGLQFGIPGTNGPTADYGGYPQFSVSGFTDFGNAGGSGGPIYYDDRQYQFAANGSWVKGRHNVHFGGEVGHQDLRHFDPGTAPGHLTFSSGTTTLNAKGAPGGNQFNGYASFLLGLVGTADAARYPYDGERAVIIMPTYRLFVQDQWQAMKNLTVSAGLGWNYFPMGSRTNRGLERYNYDTNVVTLCGEAGHPHDCGYDVSLLNFSPNLGFAWRVRPTFVVRAGYSLNFDPETYAYNRDLLTNYPEALSLTVSSPTSWIPATTLAQGIPAIAIPDLSSGSVVLPKGFSVSSLPQHPRRDYVQSWNFSLQKEIGHGFTAQAAYAGTRGVDIPQQLNLNVGQVGGGTASELFNRRFGTTATIRLLTPVNHTHYDALQTQLTRRMAQGLQVRFGYTFSKNTGICCDDLSDGAPAIQLMQYIKISRSLEPTDRTDNFNASALYELPFGKGKRWANRGIGAAVAGGWQLNTLFVAYSGSPFSVSGPSTSLNAPGNTQRADQVKASVAMLGGTGPGQSWFDPLAFAPVTDVRFGTAGFNTLRGPGTRNADLSLFRTFRVTERISMQFRAEAFNLTNTPHFANPNGNVSGLQLNADGSVKNLGGFTTITATTGTGREGIDQRALRFGVRLGF